MPPLPEELKRAAERAFHDNSLLRLLTPEEREQAAAWYEAYAPRTVGAAAELARLYNLERARFLRGQVARIADTAPNFGREIGYGKYGGKGGT